MWLHLWYLYKCIPLNTPEMATWRTNIRDWEKGVCMLRGERLWLWSYAYTQQSWHQTTNDDTHNVKLSMMTPTTAMTSNSQWGHPQQSGRKTPYDDIHNNLDVKFIIMASTTVMASHFLWVHPQQSWRETLYDHMDFTTNTSRIILFYCEVTHQEKYTSVICSCPICQSNNEQSRSE